MTIHHYQRSECSMNLHGSVDDLPISWVQSKLEPLPESWEFGEIEYTDFKSGDRYVQIPSAYSAVGTDRTDHVRMAFKLFGERLEKPTKKGGIHIYVPPTCYTTVRLD